MKSHKNKKTKYNKNSKKIKKQMTKLNNKKGSGNINLDLGEKYFENSLESILTFYNKYKKRIF